MQTLLLQLFEFYFRNIYPFLFKFMKRNRDIKDQIPK